MTYTLASLCQMRQRAQAILDQMALGSRLRVCVQLEPRENKNGELAVLTVSRMPGEGGRRSNGASPAALIPFAERDLLDDVVPHLAFGALGVSDFNATPHGATADFTTSRNTRPAPE